MIKNNIAMTIAGSDSGGGAGIQADLKTFASLGVYGTCVITVVTAQNTLEVKDVEILSDEIIINQFETLINDIYPDSIKIGMLGNPEVVVLISKLLSQINNVPIVLDPVMIAKSGDQLISDDAISKLCFIAPQSPPPEINIWTKMVLYWNFVDPFAAFLD